MSDIMNQRGGAVRAVVLAVQDGGQVQAVDVRTHEGVERTGIEVYQTFGVASRPPAGEGAIALLVAVGADQGDQLALPLACPSVRFGGLEPGEVVIYDTRGNRVHIRAGGIIEIQAAVELRIVAPLVTITGDLEVAGDVSDRNGSMQEMRDRYNAHGHAGASPPPSPLMD